MKQILLFLIIPLFLFSCAGGVVQEITTPAQKKTVNELKATIADINASTPDSLSAQLEIFGRREEKKYQSAGEIAFEAMGERLSLTLSDIIFRTAYTMLFKNGESVSLYYPLAKELIFTTTKQMQVGFIAGLSIDIHTLIDIVRGKIPLIANHTARQVADPENPARICMILENRDCYETISFIGGKPDRVLFVWKASQEKIEFYMKEYHTENGVNYYKNMRIISESQKLDIDITFKKIRINVPVQVKTEKDVKIPKDVKIITQ